MGDPEADVENEVLKIEQELQVILYFCFHSVHSKLLGCTADISHVFLFDFFVKFRLAEDPVVMLPSCQH